MMFSIFAFNLLSSEYGQQIMIEKRGPIPIKRDQSIKQALSSEKKKIFVTITAYSSTPDQTDDTPFITASGSRVRDGVIAANFLKFGTKVKIPSIFGEKIFIVEDRMHSRFQNRLDVWFPERQLAKNFGIKKSEIVILGQVLQN